jgi:hypothetical protein
MRQTLFLSLSFVSSFVIGEVYRSSSMAWMGSRCFQSWKANVRTHAHTHRHTHTQNIYFYTHPPSIANFPTTTHSDSPLTYIHAHSHSHTHSNTRTRKRDLFECKKGEKKGNGIGKESFKFRQIITQFLHKIRSKVWLLKLTISK